MQSQIVYTPRSEGNSEYSVIMPKFEDLNPGTDFPMPLGEITQSKYSPMRQDEGYDLYSD